MERKKKKGETIQENVPELSSIRCLIETFTWYAAVDRNSPTQQDLFIWPHLQNAPR